MNPEETNAASPAAANPFTAADAVSILSERGWLAGQPSAGQLAWCEHAAALLGPQATDRAALEELLRLVFHYEAQGILERVESHAVLARYAARDVLRELALLLLEGQPLDSDRFKEIIAALKEHLELRGREIFHPIRLALAGRAGEGELDRVILLLDEAAALSFAARVKSARVRILEFCSALD
jgi:nondiscriminating glutamyl-tRNA synthetase